MKNNVLRIIAFILNILSAVSSFLCGIWMIICGIVVKYAMSDPSISAQINDLPRDQVDLITSIGAGFCVFIGFICILSLAWIIPMSVHIAKPKKLGVAFKVCNLLFVNLISGILLLCDSADPEEKVEVTATEVNTAQ